jgi:hypothetical protein
MAAVAFKNYRWGWRQPDFLVAKSTIFMEKRYVDNAGGLQIDAS